MATGQDIIVLAQWIGSAPLSICFFWEKTTLMNVAYGNICCCRAVVVAQKFEHTSSLGDNLQNQLNIALKGCI